MSYNPVAQALTESPLLILDGALATELEARGCHLADALWSAKVLMENPELIYQVHYDYFVAGARCAITASYQATPQGFAARGLDEAQSLALIAQSVALARRARQDYLAVRPDAKTLLVAGSVGPYGAFLADGSEYRGDYALPEAEMIAFHRPRVQALLAAGADLLACETLPSFAEAQALVKLLAEFPQGQAWFSVTLRDAGHQRRHAAARSGELAESAAAGCGAGYQLRGAGERHARAAAAAETHRQAAGGLSQLRRTV